MSDRLRVILDTDIGTDIDDAVALAYLLLQPRCELVGISIASGAQLDRARLADAVCRAAGRAEVPIHCGPEPSLLRGVTQGEARQAAALERWPHRADFAPSTAVEWLRQTIRANPGEITLLSIGPLTNIGLLFATDPEIPSLLAGYTMMGGRFLPYEAHGPYSEWNILCDPEAARIAFDRGPVGTQAVGLDVTLQCTMEPDAVRSRFRTAGGPLSAVLDMAEVWFHHAGRLTFHDPLAAACLFEPDLCTWRDGQVRVDTHSELAFGLTRFDAGGEQPQHRIAATVEPARFFDHYFGVVGG